MAAFVFDKCCGCIKLKTGCFIIAYLSLVGYLLFSLFFVILLAGGAVLTAADDSGSSKPYDYGSKFSGPSHKEEAKVVGVVLMIVSGLALLVILIMLTFIIVLIVGLHKNKPGHLKAYIVYACIFIVLSILQLIGAAFGDSEGKAATIVQGVFNILWNIYTTLVIRSQYFAMRAPERGPAIYSSA